MTLNNILALLSPVPSIVPFNPISDKLHPFNFTSDNNDLTEEIINDTKNFSQYINAQLATSGCRYGIGGYNEHRTLYGRSAHFDGEKEPRRLHLGIDIWGPAGTPVYTPLPGTIHSFRFNDHFGDYGATIILRHEINGYLLHTLYGHLDLMSLSNLVEGTLVEAGQNIARFGNVQENGHWPPHLHFQIIVDMQGKTGDYPGVCRFSEKEAYLENCPDPDLLLRMNKYV